MTIAGASVLAGFIDAPSIMLGLVEGRGKGGKGGEDNKEEKGSEGRSDVIITSKRNSNQMINQHSKPYGNWG